MNQRDRVQLAYLQNDAGAIAALVLEGAPLTGYDLGYNLGHMAVLTGEPRIVGVTIKLLGGEWELLQTRKNRHGLTPRELAVDLEMGAVVEMIDSFAATGSYQARAQRGRKPDPVREGMPIEQELEEQKFDAAGRRNRQKLSANASGKPYWID